jgi:hypothetical protein
MSVMPKTAVPVKSLTMSWFQLNLRQATVKELCRKIVQLDDFTSGYDEEFAARGYLSPAQFRCMKFKRMYCCFAMMFDNMEFAPNTALAIQPLCDIDISVDMADYADSYGEPLERAQTIREAYVEDVAAIKMAVVEDMQRVKDFLAENFKTSLGENGFSEDVAKAIREEIQVEKKRLYGLIAKAEQADSATLVLENLAGCLNAGGEDEAAPSPKKAKKDF